MVRVFVPAGDEQLELTGIVEHSGSGRSEHFRGADGLIEVVIHQLELTGIAQPQETATARSPRTEG